MYGCVCNEKKTGIKSSIDMFAMANHNADELCGCVCKYESEK